MDLEKNGVLLDGISSIVSKDKTALSTCPKQGDDIDNVILGFRGNNISKISEDCYSMDYSIDMQIPVKNRGSMTIGCSSSINIKSGQSVYIYESNIYKVKLTVTRQ